MPTPAPGPDELNASLCAEADRLLDGGLRGVLSSFGPVTVSSADVYDAVIDHGVRDVDAYHAFLRSRT